MRRFKIEFKGPNGGTHENIFDKYDKWIIEDWINEPIKKSWFRICGWPLEVLNNNETLSEEEMDQWIIDVQQFLKNGLNVKYGK
jgi:hypothetical protein